MTPAALRALKKTPWFGADVKPVRRGVYRTRFDGAIGFCMWDGKKWWNQSASIEGALTAQHLHGIQKKRWRGLEYHEAKRQGTA